MESLKRVSRIQIFVDFVYSDYEKYEAKVVNSKLVDATDSTDDDAAWEFIDFGYWTED